MDSGRGSVTDGSAKRDLTHCPLWLGEQLEYWPDKHGAPPKFVAIAALHSELVAVSTLGQLFQWKWNEMEPYDKYPEVG